MALSDWHYYNSVTLTDDQKADLERAAVLIEGLGPEVWEAIDHDLFTEPSFPASMVRGMKEHQADDDTSEVYGLMQDLYKRGHQEIARLVLPNIGYRLDLCEKDWTEDMEKGE